MIKKYLPFFTLQILANLLWAFWALPAIGEAGSLQETLKWLGVQILFPIFFCLLLTSRRKSAHVLMVIYGALTGLYALGMTGWALIGEGTPFSVYAVCAIFFVVSFGIVFQSLKDLNVGQKARRYDEIKD